MFLLCFFMYLIEIWLDTICCVEASASATICCAWVHRIANFFRLEPDTALSSHKNTIFEKSVEYLTMSLFSQKFNFWNCVWQSITDRGFCRRYSEPALQIGCIGYTLRKEGSMKYCCGRFIPFPEQPSIRWTSEILASQDRLCFIQKQQTTRFCISNLFGLSAYVTISFIVNSGFLF